MVSGSLETDLFAVPDGGLTGRVSFGRPGRAPSAVYSRRSISRRERSCSSTDPSSRSLLTANHCISTSGEALSLEKQCFRLNSCPAAAKSGGHRR